MKNSEDELEQIRKERKELERFKQEIADRIQEIKSNPNDSPQKCAVLEKMLEVCFEKKKGDGSVYDNFFSRPKQEKKDEDEEALRKKKLEASKKSGGYKPQM
jgi:predicted transcriptional regulator